MEDWRPVVGNDLYEISNCGRVRRAKPGLRTRVGRMLKLEPHRSGHIRVRMRPDGKRHRYVHQLVWEAFVAPIPLGMVINHLNGVPSDNRLENLEVCTQRDNIKHAYQIGLMKAPSFRGHEGRKGFGGPINFGSKNPSARLTEADVQTIRAHRQEGMTGAAISRLLGLKERTVQHVLSGRYWAGVGHPTETSAPHSASR